MEEFRIEYISPQERFIKQADTVYYRCHFTQNKNGSEMILKNTYDDMILTLSWVKSSGFRFFRGNRNHPIVIHEQAVSGTLEMKENSYLWKMNGVQYRFICRKQGQTIEFVLCDRQEVLGCVQDACGKVTHNLYSMILCAFWLWIDKYHEDHEDIVCDEQRFMQLMNEYAL